jgi:Tol biopolymer transport system component
MATAKYPNWNIKVNQMIKINRLFCLFTIILLAACTESTVSPGKYALVVGAGRGKLLFAQRVIYAVDEHGNLLKLNLPKEEELGNDPEWSPNGQWIVHSTSNPNPSSASDYDIYLIKVSNENKVVKVTHGLRTPNAPTWSPDGAQIAFYAYDTKSRSNGIYLLNVECILKNNNCNPEPMFLTPGANPDWSPDGKKIVYQIYRRGIYIVDIQNSGEPVNVSQCGISPQWSPDGKKIAFLCDKSIYITDSNGENSTKLIDGALYLRWSPDGKKIAFIGTEILDSNLGQVLDLEGTIDSTAVFIMDANGANVKRVTNSNEESIGWFTWVSTNIPKIK